MEVLMVPRVVIEGPVVFNISQDIIDRMMGASQDIFQGIEFLNSEYVFTTDINLPDKDISISAQAIAIALAQKAMNPLLWTFS